MNLKRIFGLVLTLLGIAGLIYASFLFINTTGGTRDTKALIIFGILGLLFFFSGDMADRYPQAPTLLVRHRSSP